MSYDDFKNAKSEAQFCIEYLNTLKKNNKSEKEMLEYKSLTLLKDFKNQEKELLTPIEINDIGFSGNTILGVGVSNKNNNEALQSLNEMEDKTYLKIYIYLKKTNPSKLNDYIDSIKDVTNQYAGMKAANARISKLDKLSDEEIIDDSFYKDLIKKNFNLDIPNNIDGEELYTHNKNVLFVIDKDSKRLLDVFNVLFVDDKGDSVNVFSSVIDGKVYYQVYGKNIGKIIFNSESDFNEYFSNMRQLVKIKK